MGGDGSSALIGTLASSVAGNNKPPPYAEIEQLFRDARLMTIGGGTAEIMKYLVQREVYKERGF